MFGTDSHTCNAGAFGQFASGIGNTDAGFILGTGKLLIKVPPSIRFVLDGEMPPYLLAKDIILQIIGEITVAGNCYYCPHYLLLVPGCSKVLVTSHTLCLYIAASYAGTQRISGVTDRPIGSSVTRALVGRNHCANGCP